MLQLKRLKQGYILSDQLIQGGQGRSDAKVSEDAKAFTYVILGLCLLSGGALLIDKVSAIFHVPFFS